uniref:SH3b domain-containing protein n=1 Tax=uncultured bacterium contig00081 TaxID=1181557 RepID=A0A806KJM9_9BACT|nr:hypothetical protein [uncultured bacterium contig00081]
MIKINKKSFVIAWLLILVFCSQAQAQTLFATDRVNFRAAPSLDATINETLSKGTRVTETERLANGWSAVLINGTSGFISNQFLSTTPPRVDMYTQDGVNFRSAPIINPTNIKRVLPLGARVIETERLADGWSAVLVGDETGYIRTEFLSEQPPAQKKYTLVKVNLRTDPSTDSPDTIIKTLPAGTIVEEYIRLNEGWSLVGVDGIRGYIFNEHIGSKEAYDNSLKTAKSSSKPASSSSAPASETVRSSSTTTIHEIAASGVELVDWKTVKANKLFPTGVNALVTDVWTGKQYYVRSFSNGNHADVEPVTKSDTETMKSTYGGTWSWDTRPIWVTINGHTYAASINGMPHGGGVISGNGMDGQICLHFRGSLTHNGNRSHENSHQASVTAAWNAANR